MRRLLRLALCCELALAVLLVGEPLPAAQEAAEDAAVLVPIDPPNVRQARRDLLREIRMRCGHYTGGEIGGWMDMFLRDDPAMDRKANEAIVNAVPVRIGNLGQRPGVGRPVLSRGAAVAGGALPQAAGGNLLFTTRP